MIQFDLIRAHDPELCGYMEEELARQRSHLELIASENFVSETVMAAMGSHLTNKYAEGYPGKRYYGGCECVDKVEDLARDRVKSSLVRNMQMSSPIPAHRRTFPFILRFLTPAIRFSA